jgi:hypothetical protein
MAEAGWYEDPAGSMLVRYWDGAAWTERLRARPAFPATCGAAAPVVPLRPQQSAAAPVVAFRPRLSREASDVPAWFVASVLIGIMAVLAMMLFAAVAPT